MPALWKPGTILVDTAVWVAHLRGRLPALAALLEQERVLTHPFVVGELACVSLAGGLSSCKC